MLSVASKRSACRGNSEIDKGDAITLGVWLPLIPFWARLTEKFFRSRSPLSRVSRLNFLSAVSRWTKEAPPLWPAVNLMFQVAFTSEAGVLLIPRGDRYLLGFPRLTVVAPRADLL